MMYALIPVCLCLMVLFLMKESKKEYVPAVSLKGLASACFVILGFMLSNGAKTAQLITTGLLLGAIADVLLNLRLVFPEKGQPTDHNRPAAGRHCGRAAESPSGLS